MRVRVFGFYFDKDGFPTAAGLTRATVFEHLATAGERMLRNDMLRIAATSITVGSENWWGGAIIKVRDAKRFNTLKNRKLTSRQLADGEQIAEVNFFIAHPVSGSGLYAHYYCSASMTSDFRWACWKTFNDFRRERRDGLIQAAGSTREQKEIREAYSGTLALGQLVTTESLKALVKALKRVNSVTVNLATVRTTDRLFRGIKSHAVSESVRFTYPAEMRVGDFADEVGHLSESDQIERLSVVGVTPTGKAKTIHIDKNPFVFEDWDYDEAMADLDLDLDDVADSITSSSLIRRLVDVSKNQKIRQLLVRS